MERSLSDAVIREMNQREYVGISNAKINLMSYTTSKDKSDLALTLSVWVGIALASGITMFSIYLRG